MAAELQRSAAGFPADPDEACALLRALFPGWDINYTVGQFGPWFTAWRKHATGRSGTGGPTPTVLAQGMEMTEEAVPWPE